MNWGTCVALLSLTELMCLCIYNSLTFYMLSYLCPLTLAAGNLPVLWGRRSQPVGLSPSKGLGFCFLFWNGKKCAVALLACASCHLNVDKYQHTNAAIAIKETMQSTKAM